MCEQNLELPKFLSPKMLTLTDEKLFHITQPPKWQNLISSSFGINSYTSNNLSIHISCKITSTSSIWKSQRKLTTLKYISERDISKPWIPPPINANKSGNPKKNWCSTNNVVKIPKNSNLFLVWSVVVLLLSASSSSFFYSKVLLLLAPFNVVFRSQSIGWW